MAGGDVCNVEATLLNRKEVFAGFCLVAIGANLTASDGCSPLQVCERAAMAVTGLANCEPGHRSASASRSRWYSTAPIPQSSQPRYINGMVRLWCALRPSELLARLQAIELREGRVRGEANAARTLDLDLIDMGGRNRASPDPVLPHPRAHLRAFVLLPLRDVAPDWVHPRSGLTVQALIDSLPAQDITML